MENRKHDLIICAEKARDFLIGSQRQNGVWSDFEFHVGGSTSWTTALCLLNMSFLPRYLHSDRLTQAYSSACNYLQQAQTQNGGWGYNERVPEDADSTIHALLALSTITDIGTPLAISHLLLYETEYGSFRTFFDRPEGHSWGLVHHEVGAVIAIGLNDLKRASALAELVNIDLKRFGKLTSFWWGTQSYPAYTYTWMLDYFNLKDTLPNECRTYLIRQCSTDTMLSLALTGLVAGYWDENELEESCMKKICEFQCSDGSWEPSPCLRNVSSDCTEQWQNFRKVNGPLYPDINRIVTTSFALRFISNVLKTRTISSN